MSASGVLFIAVACFYEPAEHGHAAPAPAPPPAPRSTDEDSQSHAPLVVEWAAGADKMKR